MNAQEYRALVDAKICIDCGDPAQDGRVRCRDCNRLHNDDSRARYGAHTYACTNCRQVGHNRRRCPQLQQIASPA
jgi:hypothetical protein